MKVLVLTFYICVGLFSVYWGMKAISVANIPCGVAEISPDFNNEQRKQCRITRGAK